MRDQTSGLALGAALVDRVQTRSVANDFIEIDALLQSGLLLKRILAAARSLHGRSFEPLLALKALTCFEGGDLKSLAEEVRERLVKAAVGVDPARPPVMRATPRLDTAPKPSGRPIRLPRTGSLLDVARRVIWFQPPEQSLAEPIQLLAYAAKYATAEDMVQLRRHMTDDAFRWALDRAPPGVIDARSWCYWNAILGRYPPPPMPVRTFGEAAAPLTPSSSGRASRASCRRRG